MASPDFLTRLQEVKTQQQESMQYNQMRQSLKNSKKQGNLLKKLQQNLNCCGSNMVGEEGAADNQYVEPLKVGGKNRKNAGVAGDEQQKATIAAEFQQQSLQNTIDGGKITTAPALQLQTKKKSSSRNHGGGVNEMSTHARSELTPLKGDSINASDFRGKQLDGGKATLPTITAEIESLQI